MDKDKLSPKKAAVVKYLQQGLSAREIGKRMGISARTVEFHIGELHAMFGVKKTTLLVALTLQEKRSKK